MKKFKKLIPAICMLLVSAIILGGSTFAWFSMNDKVTATGMSVTAKTNTKFLVIAQSAATGDLGTEITQTLSIVNGYGITLGEAPNQTKNNVYPVAYTTENNTNVYVTNDRKTIAETKTLQKDKWYTAHSPKYNSVYGDKIEGKDVVTNFLLLDETINPAQAGLTEVQQKTNLGKYALKYTVKIGLAKDSETVTGKFTVTAKINEKGKATLANDSVKVLVIVNGKDNSEVPAPVEEQRLLLYNNDTAGGESNTANVKTTKKDITLKAAKTQAGGTVDYSVQQVAEITVYIFIDGNSASVKDLNDSNKLTEISGDIELSFHMSGIAG